MPICVMAKSIAAFTNCGGVEEFEYAANFVEAKLNCLLLMPHILIVRQAKIFLTTNHILAPQTNPF